MGKHTSILIVFLICVSGVNAQIYNFKNYSSDQGLPESEVKALCQDRRGNLWIGTSGKGLIRFDSYHFYPYGEEQGIWADSINTICEDTSGNLWIGTEQGAYIYDGRSFRLFNHLFDLGITTILEDGAHNIWLGSKKKGLYKYDGKTITPFKTTFKGILDNEINYLYLDRGSNLWVGTPTGVAKYNEQQFRFFTKEHGLQSSAVNAITEDQAGNLWFATDAGISSFNGKEFTNYPEITGLTRNRINAVMAGDKNNIWCGTSAGIFKYDGKTFRHYDLTTGQAKNPVVCSYRDAEGNLWFGTSKGLSKLDSERFTHYPENDQMGQRVYSIVEAINGNIICGTSLGGTTVFDGQHYSLLDQREGFTSSVVQCFYYSADSSLWIGTQDDGIYKFTKSGLNHYTREEGLSSDNVTGFVVDGKQNMWIASADSGVVVATITSDSLRIVKKYTTENGLSSNRVNGIAYNGETIWIGTADTGVIRIDNGDETEIFTNITAGLEHSVIHTIITDSLRRFYLATSRGVRIYDGNKVYSLTRAQGLSSNMIYSLVIDRQRNLWAGTEQGVDMIPLTGNLSAEDVRHFGSDEGFKGLEVYRNSSCVDRKGNIWFGTINGLVKYNPGEDRQLRTPPKINLTGIKLFFDKIEDTPYGDSVSAWFPIPVQLELPYDQNNLTFSFAGIYHHNPLAVRYKWILEGFSKSWSPVVNDQQAIFSNLPPGDYTFKVIAANENNVWSPEPAAFSFSVTAPVWQRWWFRVAGFSAVVLSIWMVFYSRLKRVQAKNKVIQERLEMEKSILELEQEAARLQMNPHFIFNCLNSIQGFISTNDPFQAKKYLAKFARLMRLILENAREEFIPLQHEINMLENYLELEKLSTQQPFEFSIKMEESIDPERIQIPPMMVQPFVENAIVHGLKKKDSKGSIAIHFKIKDEVLICTIRDNGIGRKQAAHVNGHSRGQHKSAAIPITQKRLEQYGSYRKVNAGVEITDLQDEGEPSGTEVIVSTPYETF
jgi:ligand-binding sensor domain-containing protein